MKQEINLSIDILNCPQCGKAMILTHLTLCAGELYAIVDHECIYCECKVTTHNTKIE